MGVRKNFAKDVVYSGISKYSTIIIALIVTAVLSRILTPSDFGVVAIATVFITFFNLLSDFGIATAIVQFKDLTVDDIKSIFAWTFWLAVLLSMAFYFISPFISSYYDNSKLQTICQLLSVQIFFATLNIVPNALLLKEKKFNVIAVRTLSIQLSCGIISVITAFNGLGVYSLLINPILGIFVNFLINAFYVHLPISLIPTMKSMRKIFSFSIFQFLFNFINYIGNNLDKMIVGKTISLAGLGYYEKAYRLGQMPAQTILGVISPVLHPYLSDYQSSPEIILSVYNKLNKLLLSISFPISAYCFFCSRDLILLIFGSQWVESITYFAILSVTISTSLATSPTGAVLLASNKTKLLFILGSLNVCIALSLLCVGAFLFGSIMAICIMGVISSIICFILTYIASYKYCFKKTPFPVFLFTLRPLSFFVLFGIIGILTDPFFSNYNIILSLFLKTIIWMVSTFIFLKTCTPFNPVFYFNRVKSKIYNRY